MCAATTDLFAYGTLIFPEVMEAVLGRRPPMRPAALEDHVAIGVRGKPYPGLAARPGARAAGILWEGLAPSELARLDAYEGEAYVRRVLDVVSRGARQPAQVYLRAPGRALELTDVPWDPTRFRREHLEAWLAGLRRDRSGRG